ncbi:MAG: response regulator transcription factor [Clostridium sp.]
MRKILVVEDEYSINDILTFALRKDGYDVRGVYNGEDAVRLVDEFKPDLVLLDIMLPGIDGFEVCKRISSKAFIVMLTARNDVIDKILGIEIGADDYITKPFEVREVMARVKSIFRRFDLLKTQQAVKEVSKVTLPDRSILDIHNRLVTKDGQTIELKRKEMELLIFFSKNMNRTFTRTELLDNIWGYDYDGEERTVDVHIRRLRARLNEDKATSIIETVFGVGYVMRCSDEKVL